MKVIFIFILITATVLGCNQSNREISVVASYTRSFDALEIEVKITSLKETEILLYNDIKKTIFLGVMPPKVNGRPEYILTQRQGDMESIILSPGNPHSIHFSAIIEESHSGNRVDFGGLGFFEIGTNETFDLGVTVYPAELLFFNSGDGYTSNYIEIDLWSEQLPSL